MSGLEERTSSFERILDEYQRIGLCGGPKFGKTTLASRCTDRPVFHTDDYLLPRASSNLSKREHWSEIPEILKLICDGQDKFLLEGVQVARAMRKGLELDCLVLMAIPKEKITKGQVAMWKGIMTVLKSFEITIPVYIEEGENTFVNYTGFSEWLR